MTIMLICLDLCIVVFMSRVLFIELFGIALLSASSFISVLFLFFILLCLLLVFLLVFVSICCYVFFV